ncbi:TPA: hypothetical protein HA251_08755 [Candidatus Woesearchaeota archaeon]|nr:hypothetical protein [Candidatus Woesearchaeota archaeon]
MKTYMKPLSQKISTKMLGVGLFAIGLGASACGYRPVEYVVNNPVLLERTVPDMGTRLDGGNALEVIASCERGFLTDDPMVRTHDGLSPMPQHHEPISRSAFRIERNLPSNMRPMLVVTKRYFGNTDSYDTSMTTAVLHLRPGDKIPYYQSYGNAGAIAAHNSGTYPCPTWQWKD